MAEDVTTIELKDLLDFIPVGSLEEVKDLAGFKEKFNEAKYIRIADAAKNSEVVDILRPTILTGVDEVFKKACKRFNNFSEEEYGKQKRTVDKMTYITSLFDAEVTELNARISDTSTASDREKELDEKLKTLNQVFEGIAPIEDMAAFRNLTGANKADKIRAHFENVKDTALTELKTTHTTERVSNETGKLFAGLNYSDQFGTYAKTGFEVEVNKKFNFAFDNDKLVVTNKEGNQVQNPDKHGEFLSPLEIMNAELKEANGLKSNGVNTDITVATTQPVDIGDGKTRKPLPANVIEAADDETKAIKNAQNRP